MTADTIQTLSAAIPDDVLKASSLAGRLTFNPIIGYDPHVHRFVSSYRDLDFGWHYARLTAQHNLPVVGGALLGTDDVLWRAYLFCRDPRRYGSRDIQMALALASHELNTARTTVEGLLLSKDATHQSVATKVKLPIEAVVAFERLFFNVLDRKDDTLYLQSILYPHGRLVELMDDYLEKSGFRQLVRRTGYNNGAEDVMYLVGSSNSAVDAISKADSPQRLEGLIMAYGHMLARIGGLNQGRLVGLQNAKQLLAAGKLGGEELEDRPMAQDFSQVVRSELLRYAMPKNMDRMKHLE